jgi:alpha-glucosidase
VLLVLACGPPPGGVGPPDGGDGDADSDADSDSEEILEPPLMDAHLDDLTFAAGLFDVRVVREECGTRLEVTHQHEPGRVIFDTVPCSPFVLAAAGTAVITERRGSYDIDDPLHAVCDGQTVDAAGSIPGGVAIRGTLSGEGCAADFELRFIERAPGQLGFEVELFDDSPILNRVFLRYGSTAGERFLGFGAQYSVLDPKGRLFPVLSQEQGIGRGAEPVTSFIELLSPGSGGEWYSTYAAVPFYLTSRNRALVLENSEVSFFDLRDDHAVTIKVLGPRLAGRILHGSDPLALIEEHTAFAGRMPPLPEWAGRGALVGMQGGTDAVRTRWAELAAQGTPIAAFWLQDWVGRRQTLIGSQLWWNWELDEQRYPGWDELVSDLAASGIRVLTYVNPFLADVSTKTGVVRHLLPEAVAAGHVVEREGGGPYLIENTDFSAALVDLSSDDARAWLKDVIAEQILGAGASGYMADYGEALPFDCVLHSGEDPAAWHNRYPGEWARLHRELLVELGLEDEALVFLRAGHTRSPSYAGLFWLGDQLVTFDEHDGLRSMIKGLLSSGVSGMSLNHADIGGYTTVSALFYNLHRSEELLLRGMEAAAFTAAFRTHEGSVPEDNVQFYTNDTTRAHFARFASVFALLADVRAGLMQEATERGWPLARHLALHYPDDPVSWGIEYQWLLGPDLLVAPVSEQGADSVEVYLPAGLWVHVWTGDVIGSELSGTWTLVDAPLGRPPVFHRLGSAAGQAFVAALDEAGLLE